MMKTLDDIKKDRELINAIDWEMTPDEAVRLYLEWGETIGTRGNYVIRSKDDVSHYFVVNTWKGKAGHLSDPPKLGRCPRAGKI